MNSTLTMPNHLDQALIMAAHGARIVFYPSASKACTISKWQDLATTDADAITAMAEANPTWTNYACVAKAVEDGLIIFDDDSGIIEEYEKIYGAMPSTLKICSFSGKYHYYFKHTAESIAYQHSLDKSFIKEKKPKGVKGELWSLRMDNSYCVGPGSVVTEKGQTGGYTVACDADVAEIPDTLLRFCRERYEAAECAPAAALTIREVGEPVAAKPVNDAVKDATQRGKEPKTKKDWERELNSDEPIEDGERNNKLTSIGGYLRRVMKFDEAMINGVLQDINSRRCEPPLPAGDVKMISGSVASYKNGEDQKTVNVTETSVEDVRGLVHVLLYTSPKERGLSAWSVPENAEEAANFASQVIYDHLCTRGKFYYAETVGYILLKGQEDKSVTVSDDDAQFAQMLSEYGANPGQDKQYKVGKFIWMKVKTVGEEANVCYSSHYNSKTKCFYFAEQAGKLIRVSADHVDRVPNGTDGELFFYDKRNTESLNVNLDALPTVKYSLLADSDSLLTEFLFKDLVFADSAMSPEGKKILLTTYIMLLILAGVVKDRPMLQMIGDTGCGKTFFLRLLGRLVVGTTFEVNLLPDDKNQFENVLINNALAFFDNVEEVPAKLKSIFCAACTGFEVVRREYFTTAGQMKAYSKATIGLSALVPVLLTSEQTNRSMLFHLKTRGNGNLDETVMLDRFDANRSALVAEVLVRAQMVLQALKAQEKYEPRTKVRMAGVATLILRVARHEGWEPLAEALIESWNTEQLEGALRDDDVAAALYAWITRDDWKPAILSASELNTKITPLGDPGKTSWKGNPATLGRMLAKSRASYAHRFGLIIGEDRHSKTATYEFRPNEKQIMLLKAGTGADTVDFSTANAVPLVTETRIVYVTDTEDGTQVAAAEPYKPGDIEMKEAVLSESEMSRIPEGLNPDVAAGIETWAKVLVSAGWGGGVLDTPATLAVVLYALSIAGEGDDPKTVSIPGWQRAFDRMHEVYVQGGEEAIQTCLDGHAPYRPSHPRAGVAWDKGKQLTWKAAASTEKGAASIRRTYGEVAYLDEVKAFLWARLDEGW